MLIRKAEPADIPAVAAIYDRIHAEEQHGRTHTGWVRGVYPSAATAADAQAEGTLFVCEDGGQICATAILNQKQDALYRTCSWQFDAPDSAVMVMHTLAVDPDAGRRGIAAAFLAFYADYARQKGCTVLRLDTNQNNTVAQHLYAKHGFRIAGKGTCTFNGISGVPLLLLEKPLNG